MNRGRLEGRLNALWYDPDQRPGLLLRGLGRLHRGLVALRRRAYAAGWLQASGPALPIIVVGNLTAGGAGKTPFVQWLVQALRAAGVNPGIVSRGYGGSHQGAPLRVEPGMEAAVVGDEPLLLARNTSVPVIVGRDRVAAAEFLARCGVDCIVCDDGLQHLRLRRDLEVVIVDARRELGNGLLLPAGPLREPAERLGEVDFVIRNGGEQMRLAPGNPRAVDGSGREAEILELAGAPVHAVAGIGHPARFFDELRDLGLAVIEHPFPDHHDYQPSDFAGWKDAPMVMTEKDAVKCAAFAGTHWWYVPVEARVHADVADAMLARIHELIAANAASAPGDRSSNP